MHRNPLLSLLDAYKPLNNYDAASCDSFITFVQAHADCFERSLAIGHITGSAWILDPTGSRTLLTHHKKLNKWLQLGGHADGDADVLCVALREAQEESGIRQIRPLSHAIFDLDVHPIPARQTASVLESEHLHYDVRFLMRAETTVFRVSEESHSLVWVGAAELLTLTREDSVMRMREKWLNLSIVNKNNS